jgi:hypothetical protein
MTNKQESHLTMAMAASSYLAANATITATLSNFATYFTPLQSQVTQIQTIREQQEFDKTGIAENKKQLRATLTAQAIDVARRVVAYATNVNNTILLAEVSYTESDLKKSPDTILKDRSQVIYDRANANVTALTTYGVTAAILTTLLASITSFNTAIPKPRMGIADKKQATDQLVALFDALDANFYKIDTLVEMVKIAQVNFYNEYKNLRKIIDTGAGSLVLKGSAIDLLSGEPVKNATFTFLPVTNTLLKAAAINGNSNGNGNGNGHIVKKTAEKGIFYIKSATDGTYNVTIEKPGYKIQNAVVSIVNGELTVLEIALEKA